MVLQISQLEMYYVWGGFSKSKKKVAQLNEHEKLKEQLKFLKDMTNQVNIFFYEKICKWKTPAELKKDKIKESETKRPRLLQFLRTMTEDLGEEVWKKKNPQMG